MSSEAYSWNEGQIYAWTGSATASAVIAFARDMQLSMQWGIDNVSTISGTYHDRVTGQRADLSIGALFTFNATIGRMVQSATAMHMKLLHSSINGSAGFVLWSGRVDALSLVGSDDNVLQYTVQHHANRWSAF